MGKRRKTKQSADDEVDHLALDKSESRKRIRTFEDVADSDDEFHLNRDEVLLEEAPAAKRQRKVQENEAFLEQSEEEVLGESEESSEEEEEQGWGTTRGDTYGADAIETEEQALEEEAEARRLQKKQLQDMSAADYGFDEDEWAESTADKSAVVIETLPEPRISADASTKERLKMLKARYPEFEPLSRELQVMSNTVQQLTETGRNAVTKRNAGTAYLGALTMYFALLTSTAGEGAMALSAQELRDHEVMALLVDCRSTWQRAKNLQDDLPESESEESLLEDVEPVQIVKKAKEKKVAPPAQDKQQQRIAQRLALLDAEDDLDDLLKSSTVVQKRAAAGAEEAPLSKAQAEEKARKKKSLRFYTSQIAQKSNKRGVAGRTAGGDDDIPHRERLRDRQARLNAEAEKRGKKDIGDDLDGMSEDGDAEQAAELRQQVDEDDDYYDMVAARTAKKKSDKQAYAAAQKQAAELGGRVIEEEVVGTDGKRKITYAIEKNKGLTPYRKKDVRNPRVKKRKKYEEKTKKLASMKPTYKGGEGRGGYGGELTGIKANLVKSTRL